ncbi:DUF5008 domain-containing protein [Sphingobacterium hungaricum]|uniref:DUF5008 domain-containing protein n=1 Tax=Sphingobacterium hungaricum TaxID=2082723 RepID=A0A928UW89_9SPHI|nr:DUF5008 domain-containing protein [Sphingobacterium hungaricum]MBE8712269.1 hypothetical protein [Sphingobacterium hungaricum]
MKNRIYPIILGFCSLLLVWSCNKEAEFFSEPYPEPKNPLGIIIDRSQIANPATGGPGTVVTIKVAGLQEFQDKAVFQFNGQKAEIVSITATEVQVKVPAFASTGPTAIIVDDIIVYGPEFMVEGIVKVDPTWTAIMGANNSVHNHLVTTDGKIIYVGAFNNYNNKGLVKPTNRLVRTFTDGTYDVSWRTGEGSTGTIYKILQINDRYYISGAFGGYDKKRENISNLTRLNLNGELDTLGVKPWRRPNQSDTTKYVPFFNGGFNNTIQNIYESNGKIIVSGFDIRYYVKRDYLKPNARETRDTTILDSTEIRHLARLNLDGSLDKTYRFTAGGQPFAGANGYVKSMKHESGSLKEKIVVFGSFTRFDEKSTGYIARINADGTIDNTFNSNGNGADFNIDEVTFNPVTNKYMVTGEFKSFNGTTVNRVCMLNADGSLDASFQAKTFLNGFPRYAKQLNDGKIVISGSFGSYAGIVRNGFMIVDAKGDLIPELNTTGQFSGSLSNVVETTSEDGKRALLLMGSFWMFDSEPVNNITRIILE